MNQTLDFLFSIPFQFIRILIKNVSISIQILGTDTYKIKKLEIEKTEPTFIISVLKVEY